MQPLFDYLSANPWLYGAMAASLAIWLSALCVIFTSPKFLRKWLWALLTLVSFTYGWSAPDNMIVRLSVPLGALYVLGFWLVGRMPTEEEIIEHGPEPKDPANPWPTGDTGQIMALRAAYVIASLASLTLAVWAGLGYAIALMNDMAGPLASPEFSAMWSAVRYPQAVFGILFTGLFVFLIFRPYWWGKVLCLLAALSWLGFGLGSLLMWQSDWRAFIPAGAGAAMVVALLLHQVADPRFSGSYLR